MNPWIKMSIDYANQRNYLDDLFSVYPTIPEGIRDINQIKWGRVEQAFETHNNLELLDSLLSLDLFPIKDSYVAYFKRDKTALMRNPATVNRLCGRVYEMGINKVFEKCSEPKETNRQIGPLFKNWMKKGVLGVIPVPIDEFKSNKEDAILDAGDAAMSKFAQEFLGYNHDKGLDFVGRFNGRYVIGEAKFLTDFGGHQNAQFNDAISTVKQDVDAETIAILDGVLYIKGKNKMHKNITENFKEHNVMSALVLREFLYQL
jgi:hypothetical protein